MESATTSVERRHYALLLELAMHLETDQIGHKYFDALHINWGPGADGMGRYHNSIGEIGNPLGELPILFPEDWKFYQFQPYLNAIPVRKEGRPNMDVHEAAAEYFGISSSEVTHLVYPSLQLPVVNLACGHEFGYAISRTITPTESAAHIREFVAYKRNPKSMAVVCRECIGTGLVRHFAWKALYRASLRFREDKGFSMIEIEKRHWWTREGYETIPKEWHPCPTCKCSGKVPSSGSSYAS